MSNYEFVVIILSATYRKEGTNITASKYIIYCNFYNQQEAIVFLILKHY